MNTNYKLRCECDKPVKWLYFDEDAYPVDDHIVQYPTQNPATPFGIELTLFNVSVHNVRYYFCIHENLEIEESSYGSEMEGYENEGFASKIYVFVNGN